MYIFEGKWLCIAMPEGRDISVPKQLQYPFVDTAKKKRSHHQKCRIWVTLRQSGPHPHPNPICPSSLTSHWLIQSFKNISTSHTTPTTIEVSSTFCSWLPTAKIETKVAELLASLPLGVPFLCYNKGSCKYLRKGVALDSQRCWLLCFMSARSVI